MQFLERTTIPVPKVYYHALESADNDIGVPVVLMEKMPGHALRWDLAAPMQRSRIMEQLVGIFLELERHPFTSLGSIQMAKKDTTIIGGYAQAHLFKTPLEPFGPFDSLTSAATLMFQRELEMIAIGELSSLAIDNYLSHRWRLNQVSALATPLDTGHYYLKHFDDKGDHILVDDQYNITAIIDWEFASTESKALAFSSPCMMWPVGDFYRCNNQLAAEELEQGDR